MQHHLKNALPIVAAAYGDKFGVKVEIQGDSAYTDGNRIVIPAADPAIPNYRDLAWGFLAHEAAHIRHTDFNVVAESADRPIRKAILNIIEDVRIEQALGQDYPGTHKTLNQLIKSLINQGQLAYKPGDRQNKPPAVLLQTWLLFRLRSRVLKQDALNLLYQQVDQDIRQQLPTGLMTRISALSARAAQLHSTADALQLTDTLIELIEEAQDKHEQESQHSPEDSAQGELSSDQIDNGTNKEAEQLEQKTETTLQSILSVTDDELLPDLQQTVADTLGDQAETGRSPGSSPRPFTLPTAEKAMPGNPDLLTRVAAESGMIRARLRGLVQATQEKRSHYKQSGHRLCPSRLAASQTGNTKVFTKAHKRTAPNTAIYLLVDASGSMCRRGEDGIAIQQLANDAALALALALEGISGVSCGSGFFPGRQSHIDNALPIGKPVRANAACFDQSPRGTTPMAEAIWYAASQLIYRKEERKIILVITDGEPDNLQQTQEIIALCERSGIQLVGIGIQTDSVEQLFRSTSVIEDLGSLKSKLFELGKAAIG